MIIRGLSYLKATAHQKREHAESIHAFYEHKNNVPTMGGVLIVASVMISIFLWGNWSNRFMWMLSFVMLGYAALGFFDDWTKLKYKNSKGISSKAKLWGQVFISLVLGIFVYLNPELDKLLYFPFLKEAVIVLGVAIIPFTVIVLVGTSNALNLTDGLDGLAVGCTLFAVGALSIMSYISGHATFAAYLSMPSIPSAAEMTVFCSALIGACAGFLWFNCYPANVIMGDTGSMALGGTLGAIAVLLKKEVVLFIVGGVFVWEALSVIMQVTSFKLFKKRIFLMSPFHHHLQLKGWPESKVIIRFWIIALILAVIGLSTLKVR